jgi:hypothetical protein
VLYFQEKRRDIRFRITGRGLQAQVFPAGKEPLFVKIRELGILGALLEAPSPFRVGEVLEMGLPELPPLPDLKLRARVERQMSPGSGAPEGSFLVAARFVPGEPAASEALIRFIAGLEDRGIERGDP